MRLSYDDIVTYLVRRKLVSARTVVSGSLTVWELSRRNRTVVVVCEPGASYILKSGISADGTATVAHEGDVYRWLGAHADAGTVRQYLPRCYGYDATVGLLMLELVPHSRTLREHHRRAGCCSRLIAAELGRALANLHRLAIGSGGNEGPDSARTRLSAHVPWALSAHLPDLTTLEKASAANRELLTALQQQADVCAALDELRAGWRPHSLIHHDMRWDNCLVVMPEGASVRRRPEVRLIDWELAGLGDPCWDVASLFADYLSFWALSIPATLHEALEPRLERARHPLGAMQPAVRACWHAYAKHMNLGRAARPRWLRRITAYTGARLIQIAYELLQPELRLTSRGALVLQLAVNMLQRQDEALPHLLGLSTYE